MTIAPRPSERRDLAARAARDRLAGFLDVHPRELAHLESSLAQLMASRVDQIMAAFESTRKDSLTGALVRSVGRSVLEGELARARRSGAPLSIIFLDLDNLKNVNDSAGHAAGDLLLTYAVDALTANLRPYDTVVRWGGDEFVCVLPECELALARQIGDRVVTEFRKAQGSGWTAGYAELEPDDDIESLLRRADADLYSRKAVRSL